MIFFHSFMIQISSINLPKILCILSTQSLFMHRHMSSGLKPEAYKIFWLRKIGLLFSIKIECWHQKHCSSSLFGPLTPKGTAHHCNDVIIGVIPSQITSLTIVYSIVYSDADQRKHQSSVSLAFVPGSDRWVVTGEFPAQMASYAENVSIWWRHHDKHKLLFSGIVAASTHD